MVTFLVKIVFSKIDALKNAAHPTDIRSVQSFLGLTNYLKQFTPTIAHLLAL